MLQSPATSKEPARPLIFHPLCGSRLSALFRTLSEHGGVEPAHWHQLALMLACCSFRAPFCFLEDVRFRFYQTRLSERPPPVFIVGHWRSGTTLLHNLMSQDPQFVFPQQVEVLAPFDFLPSPISRLQHAIMIALLPETRPMDDVRLDADLPQEEEIALAAMGALSFFNCFYFPKKIKRIFERAVMFEGCADDEIELWRSSLTLFLAKVDALRPGRRLLLKNPANSARIAAIRRTFPGAKFIHITRHPILVYASTCKLYREMLMRVALQRFDLGDVNSFVLETYPKLMDRLLSDWQNLPENDRVTLRYEDLISAPMDVLADVYERIGLDGFADARSRIAQHLDEQPIRPSETQPPEWETAKSIYNQWKHQFETLQYDPELL